MLPRRCRNTNITNKSEGAEYYVLSKLIDRDALHRMDTRRNDIFWDLSKENLAALIEDDR